jgi:hypothetical protein
MAECAVARAARLEADGRDLLLAGDPVAPGEVLANDGWAEMDWSRLRRLPWDVTVIDGSTLTVTEVGDRVRQWIGAVRAGSAPVFRRSGE